MQTLLHEPSWTRFALSASIGGICLLILLVLNLVGQRGDRIKRAASSDFIAEMLRQEKPDNAMVPRRVVSRRAYRMRLFGRFAFQWVLVGIICLTGIETILAYKTVTNFEDGLLRFQQRHYPEAILSYNMALAADDHSANVYYYLGVALLANRQSELALDAFQKAIKRNPKLEKAHIDYGNALFQEGRYKDALLSYRAAQRLASHDQIAAADIAIALQALGKLEEAMPLYRQIVEDIPNDATARLNLANVLAHMHRYPESEKEFLLLLKQRPGNAVARLNYGIALRDQGRSNEALRQFVMATELDPHDMNTQFQLGKTLAEQGDFLNAVVAYQRVISLNQDYIPAYSALGDALERDGNRKEAITAYRNCVKRATSLTQYRQEAMRATEALRRLHAKP